MMPVIRISDTTWERLKKWAEPLVDSPDDVIRKLLDIVSLSLNDNPNVIHPVLIIDVGFINRFCSEYDNHTRGTSDQFEEQAILDGLSKQGEPKYLSREYFIRLGRWKTPRYADTREKNADNSIIETTRSAYVATEDLVKIKILKRLKGVGTAVASTILYYLQPDKFPIFDYHARRTLIKACKLNEWEDNDTEKVWLRYTHEIREIAGLNNKSIREVEKALFAYDKWGTGEFQTIKPDNSREQCYNDSSTDVSRSRIQKSADILIKATIVTQGKSDKYRYKKGSAEGEERAEIRIPKNETKLLPYKVYPINVQLVIGQREYTATLRYAKSQDAAWISSVLNNGKYELVRALQSEGFQIGQNICLKFTDAKIVVLTQYST